METRLRGLAPQRRPLRLESPLSSTTRRHIRCSHVAPPFSRPTIPPTLGTRVRPRQLLPPDENSTCRSLAPQSTACAVGTNNYARLRDTAAAGHSRGNARAPLHPPECESRSSQRRPT